MSRTGNGYRGISRAADDDGIRRYRTGVEREPNPRRRVQMGERGRSGHPPLLGAGLAAVNVVVRSRSRHSSRRERDNTATEHGKAVHRAKGDSWTKKNSSE